jgi:hypothetical protein
VKRGIDDVERRRVAGAQTTDHVELGVPVHYRRNAQQPEA